MAAERIPANWRVVSLKDTLTLLKVGARVGESAGAKGRDRVPVCNAGTIGDGEIDAQRVGWANPSPQTQTEYALETGDLLVSSVPSSDGSILCAVYAGQPPGLIPDSSLFLLRSDQTLLKPEFLLHFLRSGAGLQATLAQLTGQPSRTVRISQTLLRDLTIALPPLQEQARLVAVLNRAAEILHLRRQADAKGRGLLLALFLEMFGAPSSWEKTVPLESLADIVAGAATDKFVKDPRGTVPWASAEDVKSHFLFETRERIGEQAIRKGMLEVVPPGTILFAVKRAASAEALPFTLAFERLCFGPDLRGLIPRPGVDPFFILGSLLAQAESLLKLFRDGGTKGVRIERLLSLPVPQGLISKRDVSFAAMGLVYETEKAQGEARHKLARLYSSLAADVFSGALVPAEEKPKRAAAKKKVAAEAQPAMVEVVPPPEGAGPPPEVASATASANQAQEVAAHLKAGMATPEDKESFETLFLDNLESALEVLLPQSDAATNLLKFVGDARDDPWDALVELARPALTNYASLLDSSLLHSLGQVGEDKRKLLAESLGVIDEAQRASRDYPAEKEAEQREREEAALSLAKGMAQTAALLSGTPDKSHPHYYFLRELSEEQYEVYLATVRASDYYTAESISEKQKLDLTEVRNGLSLLASAGIVMQVSVAARINNRVAYVPAYRSPRPDDEAGADVDSLEGSTAL